MTKTINKKELLLAAATYVATFSVLAYALLWKLV